MADVVTELRAELLARMQGLAGAAGAPLESRGHSIAPDTLPRAVVWIDQDDVEQFTDGEGELIEEVRRIDFSVTPCSKGTNAAAELDAMAIDIRRRLKGSMRLGDHDYQIYRDQTEYLDEDREQSRPYVCAVMSFRIRAITPEGES